MRIVAAKHHGLIAAKARGFVDGVGIEALAVEIFLGACHEERGILVDAVEPGEIHIAAIHDIDGSWLPEQLVHDVYVVDRSRSNDHRSGDAGP